MIIRFISYLIFIIGILYILFGVLQLHYLDVYPQDDYRFTYVLWSIPLGIVFSILCIFGRLLAPSE